ncbi:MAG: hypothetical protein WC581_06370 [Thermodesulfovibrionales bacterium]
MRLPVEQEEKIIGILRELPYEKVDAVIDFAEYLKKRKKTAPKQKKAKHTLRVPVFNLGKIEKNAFDREALYGEYLDRKFD